MAIMMKKREVRDSTSLKAFFFFFFFFFLFFSLPAMSFSSAPFLHCPPPFIFPVTPAWQVRVNLKTPGKKLEHGGIKIEFVGQIGASGVRAVLLISLLFPFPHNPRILTPHHPLLTLHSTSTELFYDRGNHHEFATTVKELAPPGDLMKSTTFDFEFHNVEKQHETYTGINVRLRCVGDGEKSRRETAGKRGREKEIEREREREQE